MLGDIGIDPNADAQAPILIAAEHAHRIREGFAVPFKIAPIKSLHPETVKMEHMQRDVPVGHALDKGGDGFFVIAGGKTGGQPKAEAPGRGQGRPPGERGVTPENLFGRRPIDQAVGRKVEYLKRISMGPLVLDKELKKGEYRPLFEEELAKLKESTASK